MESTTEWTLNLLGSEDGLRVVRTKEAGLPLALIRGKLSLSMLAHLQAISAEGPLPTRWGLRLLVMDLSRQGQQILQYRNPPRLERLVVLRREELIRGYWFRNSDGKRHTHTSATRFRMHKEDIKRRCEQRRLMEVTARTVWGQYVTQVGQSVQAQRAYSRRLLRPAHQLSQIAP